MRSTFRLLGAAGLLGVTAWLSACADDPTPASPVPSPSFTPSATAAPLPVQDTGSDGLTVRYLGSDGKITTVPVEKFRH